MRPECLIWEESGESSTRRGLSCLGRTLWPGRDVDEGESSWSHRKGTHPVRLLGPPVFPQPKGCLTEARVEKEEAWLEVSGGWISAERMKARPAGRASACAPAVPGHPTADNRTSLRRLPSCPFICQPLDPTLEGS